MITPLTRNIFALLFAAVLTYSLGTSIGTVLEYQHIPAKIPTNIYVEYIMKNLNGQKAYFAVILLGFLIAFPVAAKLRKILTKIAIIGYPLAGAVAIGTALGLMYLYYETVPIQGARSTIGLMAQLGAGAIGGTVFAILQKPIFEHHRRAKPSFIIVIGG